jgi:outer membrane receptor protein involved in Fe transport
MDSSVLEFDAKADGPLFSAPGGLARLAIGGQFRHESYESTGDAFATTGALDRDVWAAFGELFVPIFGQENERPGLYRLELTLAGRLDDYSDFGSSFNPKVGMLWSPVRGLHLRGTWARSFRAPLLSELDETPNGAQILPLPDPTSPAGASIAAVIVGNNSALGPERSTSWTLGFDLAPPSLPGLDFGVTYFNFDFTDRIATPVPNTALFTVLQNENLYAEAIVRNPTPAAVDAALDGLFIVNPGGFPLSAVQVILDNRIGNIASRKQDGIDVIGSYTFQAASSRFVLSANATYLFSIRDRLTSTAPIQDRLDVVFNPVDFRLRTGATWSRSALSASLFVNYTDGYRDTRTAPTTAVSSWTTVDATLRYRRDPGPGVLDGLTIALQVQNLFDEDPPFVANQLGLNFDATNASARGRFVALQVIKEW